jgi:acetyltransferase
MLAAAGIVQRQFSVNPMSTSQSSLEEASRSAGNPTEVNTSTGIELGEREIKRPSSQNPRYPVELIDVVALPGRGRVTIRPILPQDDTVTKAFFAAMSWDSRHNRFLRNVRELPEALLRQFTQVDYKTHLALIAEIFAGGREIAVGEARYVVSPDGKSAEFAVSTADEWQGCGLGSLHLARLIAAAKKAGIETITGETLASNRAMLHLAQKSGFTCAFDPEIWGLVNLNLNLAGRGHAVI